MPEKCKLILLADDDAEDLELLQEALLQEEPALQIQMAANGREVLEFLKTTGDSNLPSLIVLDYNMPDMNGAEVLANLYSESRFQTIPKVVWSTSNHSQYINECMKHGASTYLVKPSSSKELQQQARDLLALCASKAA